MTHNVPNFESIVQAGFKLAMLYPSLCLDFRLITCILECRLALGIQIVQIALHGNTEATRRQIAKWKASDVSLPCSRSKYQLTLWTSPSNHYGLSWFRLRGN